MSLREAIVTFRQIEKAVNSDFENTSRSLGFAAAAVARDAALQTAFLSQLGQALQAIEQAETTAGVLATPQNQMASVLQSFLAERAVEEGKLAPLATGMEVRFDDHDIIGWIGSFFQWWRRLRPHKFLNAAAQPDGIPNRFRAAVMGDWGTGLYGAPQCARSISGASTAYNLILHLGDVYYAGTDGEVQQRMLDIWPSVPGAMSRALNGNHEMYSGGQAYYKKALPMFGQAASYFALQNDYWVLIGLDSAYRDYDLHPNQVPWLRNIIGSAGGRKVVLFSHHQPFSLLDSQGPRLVAKLSEWLGAGRVFAWYWGHEHRCLFYEPHPAWSFFGRCIGHSGYPYFRSDVVNAPAEDNHWRRLAGRNLAPAARVLDGPNPFVTGEEERYGPNGYLTLEFDDDRVNEIVHLATGEAVYERELR